MALASPYERTAARIGWTGRAGRLTVATIVMVMALVAGTVAVSAAVGGGSADAAACTATGNTLGQAQRNYANSCSQPRVDCDPANGGWICSSEQIGANKPGGPSAPPPAPPTTQPPTTVAPPTTAPSPTVPGACTARGATLAEAQRNYANSCSQPRVDCDPIDGGWVCSSERMGPGTPAPGPNPTPVPPTTLPPGNPGDPTCGVIALEAESLPLNGAWRLRNDGGASGGSYIVWEGLSRERNNNQPTDVMRTTISITEAGTYRFAWAMRQPSDVESDKANDSWLNFPDASRFGPTSGGSYGGFVKVFGNAKGNFAYAAKADENHKKSDIAVVFDSPGTYTMEVAGRSHGHQLDRIVLYHESIDRSKAISGNPCDGQNPAPAPNPNPAPVPVPGPFDPSKDLIALHYDHAPDRDDGHATVAGREVVTHFGITPIVVGGAYGTNRDTYNRRSEAVMDATWGSGGWINAHANWNAAVNQSTDRWAAVISSGGDIWIAEGGQSDFTADVVRNLKQTGVNTNQRVHVVQHSKWNEDKTTSADLSYVRNETDYIKIDDGNNPNNTADLNDRDRGFSQCALNGRFASAWRAAFDYYPASQLVDFSDTVELLHIVGVGKDQVADAADFCDRFVKAVPAPGPAPAPAPAPAPDPAPAPPEPAPPAPNPGNPGSDLPAAPAGYRWVKVDAVTDEFDGTSLDRSKWLNDHPYWNGREPSQFNPDNVSVGGGNLRLASTVANRNQQGNWVHSAAVTSNVKVGQGYYEARIKASELSMTSSFWFQSSGGPRHEIDVVENVGAPRKNPNDARVMHSNSHYNYGRPNAISTPKRWTMPSGAADEYHVYGVWWKSEREIWLYHNGEKVNEIRTGGPFDVDQFMFFDTEVFSWVGNPTVASLDDPNRNTMYVDWVRGWRLVKN